MADKHLEEKNREFQSQGLDLETLKNKLYNWLAIEIDDNLNIDQLIPGKSSTTREKMHEKADQLAEIIDEFVRGSIVYIDRSQQANQQNLVNGTEETTQSKSLKTNILDSSGNVNIVYDDSGVPKNYNLRIR